MSLKREADPSFIKPDPDKRVKREGGDVGFSLYSIPMAPPRAASAFATSPVVAPKFEGGDRFKPLAPISEFHAGEQPSGNNRKKKFFGSTIRVRRGDEWVSAHFNKKNMTVHFVMHCSLAKQWSSVQVEQEIFERLKKAKFDIQPSEGWGFLDRKFFADLSQNTMQPTALHYTCEVGVYNTSTKKVENSPSYFKKEERTSQPKNEHFN